MSPPSCLDFYSESPGCQRGSEVTAASDVKMMSGQRHIIKSNDYMIPEEGVIGGESWFLIGRPDRCVCAVVLCVLLILDLWSQLGGASAVWLTAARRGRCD